MKYLQIWIEFCIILFLLPNTQSQITRTVLDDKFQPIIEPFRKFAFKIFGSTAVNPHLRKANQRLRRQQTHFGKTTSFFCNTTGGRSSVRPTSVHKLRPGDIDVIAAMGDSLTAGNGIMAVNVFQINTENRGVSWSIGGQENWRTFLTLPNILKEFNSNLYGYGVTDSLSTERISKFNTAEPGAMSRDLSHQVRNLIKRMKSDPNVNMSTDWKMVTILIGANDFCADMCYYNDPKNVVLRNHENDMVEALRILRDNLPRVIVNVVPPPNVRLLAELQGKPNVCRYTNLFECPCLVGWRSRYIEFYSEIMDDWQKLDKKIVQRDEFNTETFTVNFQPFITGLIFPKITNTKHDFSYMAPDCFHLSQKAHARSANALWNNIMEPDDQKTHNWPMEFKKFRCPTEKRPYLATRVNSRR